MVKVQIVSLSRLMPLARSLLIAFGLIGSLAASGCASTILIRTEPAGAEVYIDGVYHGPSPVQYTDTGIIGTRHQVETRMQGYDTSYGQFARNGNANVGAIIGGICLWVPFLWVQDYPSSLVYRLHPSGARAPYNPQAPPAVYAPPRDYGRAPPPTYGGPAPTSTEPPPVEIQGSGYPASPPPPPPATP